MVRGRDNDVEKDRRARQARKMPVILIHSAHSLCWVCAVQRMNFCKAVQRLLFGPVSGEIFDTGESRVLSTGMSADHSSALHLHNGLWAFQGASVKIHMHCPYCNSLALYL